MSRYIHNFIEVLFTDNLGPFFTDFRGFSRNIFVFDEGWLWGLLHI